MRGTLMRDYETAGRINKSEAECEVDSDGSSVLRCAPDLKW